MGAAVAAKKKRIDDEAAAPTGAKKAFLMTTDSSGVVRIKPDLARKLKVLSGASGESMTEMLDPVLRPWVESLWAQFQQQVSAFE